MSEFKFRLPKEDHSYKIKGTLRISSTKAKSYFDLAVKNSFVSPDKYSKQLDWKKKKGLKLA
jgi:hypothetical protein